MVSITGGIDSRTIAAGFRYAGVPFRTVTWTSFNLQDWEREPVNAVVRYLNGQHDWVDESNDMINDAALIGVRNSGNYRSASQVTAGMSRLYGMDADSVFVRGHGAATVRGLYQAAPGHYSPMSEASLGELVRLYLSEHHKVPPDKGVVALVENELGHFANVVNYDSIADLGYDPNDIFYWEHKQTNWIGAGFNSVDPALNSLLGFNSRPLAEAAYGLPDSVRFKKTVFHDVIKRYDSGLAAIYYR